MAICALTHIQVQLHFAGIQKKLGRYTRKIQKRYDTNKNNVHFIMAPFLVYINRFLLFSNFRILKSGHQQKNFQSLNQIFGMVS